MARVLVADDGRLIVKGVRSSLEQDGVEVDCAYNGEKAIELARKAEYDIALLGMMPSEYDGYGICQAIREFSDVLIIMLTAKGGDMNKTPGPEYDTDDYISKPFNMLEIKARIKAIIRGSGKSKRQEREEAESGVVGAGDLKMDTENRRVLIGEREINLAAKRFGLLELLARNPSEIYSREALLTYIWRNKIMDNGDVCTVDVHVRRLRERIESSLSDPRYMHAKWGTGYYLRVEA